jgi:putative peptidoglycan lipid II flippase
VSKGTDSPGLGSLASGAVTAAAIAVQTGLAAVVGVVLAREFGRGAETDGFFAAYGVFIVLALVAGAIRMAVLPSLARARDGKRLSAETAAYALALAGVAAPLLLVTVVAADPIADVLTSDGPELARQTAADALPWMVLAALLQIYAGLGASALAALDDYAIAAVGFIVASVAGLAFILLRVDEDGVVAIAWGMTLNGAISVAVPAVALAVRARREGMAARAARPGRAALVGRLAEMALSVALPLAMQAIYLVCLPLAAREGVGAVTSFGYAYLLASAVVTVTASSLSLVTSVPLTRAGLDPPLTARHVVSSSWIALAVIGASAGVFGLAGEPIVEAILGGGYAGDVGTELGRVVVVLSLWAALSVGVTVTFPLVFVAGRGASLPLLALAAVALHVPLAFAGGALAGLDGLALALAVTTALMLAVMLARLHAVRPAARGLAAAGGVVAGMTLLAFVPPRILLGPLAAAALGLALYGALLAAVRPPGLLAAWRYLRALG